jgi:hypothetical protein
MRHAFQIIAASALLLTVSAAPALSDQNCKPVIGHFEAFVVPPGQGHCPPDPAAFCTSGRVWGGMQGSYQFIMTGSYPSALINGVPTILFFTGTSTIFMKNGEQVVGTDTGSLDLPPGQGGFASLITFSGGTGSMSGAAGQIRLRGEFSAAEGTTSGDYIGSLCLP